MAQRRMFSRRITDTDHFLDMPLSAQCLYFHLNMEADDDGFIGNAKTIRRKVGASEDDLKLLIAKQFILPFETSSVVVVRDWRIHNYIQKDRYNRTLYQEERQTLGLDKNGIYHKLNTNVSGMYTSCIQNGDTGKVRLEKGKSIDRDKYICEVPAEPEHSQALQSNEGVTEVKLVDEIEETAKQVLSYLNQQAGRNFRAVQGTLKNIKARLKEGYTLDDFQKVVDCKVYQWRNDAKMSEYLRPATLFNSEKFHGYLEEANGPYKTKPKQQPRYNQPRAEVVPDWLGKQYKEQTAPSGGYHNPFAEKEG